MIKDQSPDIIFINPPIVTWPADNSAGIAYLRGFLESRGISTSVLNLDYLIKEKERDCLLKLVRRLNNIIIKKENRSRKKNNDKSIFNQKLIKKNNLTFLAQNLTVRLLCRYKINYAVNLINLNKFLSPVFEKININKNVDYVGFSINYIPQILFVGVIASYIKSKYKNIKIIVGGQIVTREYGSILNSCAKNKSFADFFVIGEGETPLYKIIKGEDVKKIPNLIYRDKNKYILTKCRHNSENVQKLPSPIFAENDLPVLQASRGCYWGKCRFCSNYSNTVGANYYRKTPEKLFKDLISITKQFKKRPGLFIFSDDSLPGNFVYKFSKLLIKNKLINYNFRCFIDIKSNYNFKTLQAAQRAGFGRRGRGRIFFGMETSSPRLNQLINKNFTVKEAIKTIELCLRLNLNIQINFIYLIPTQSKEEFIADLNFAHNIVKRHKYPSKILIVFHRFTLKPESEFAKNADKYKIKITKKHKLNNFFLNYTFSGKNILNLKDSIKEYKKFISSVEAGHKKSFIFSPY